MRFDDALAEDQVEAYTRESLDQARQFARGEDVDILVLTGLMGVSVEAPLDRTTWGLRSTEGLAIADIGDAPDRRPRSVLWAKTPHRLIRAAPGDLDTEEVDRLFADLGVRAQEFNASLNRRIMVLWLAFLAWSHEQAGLPLVNLAGTSSWSLLPIGHAQGPWVLSTGPASTPTELNSAALDRVAELVDEMGDVDPRLDIALSRLLRVASEPRDTIDALVDAVIAWENMVGSRNETTFKVCASLAWLLEPVDEQARRQLFARCKKIYGLRSELVHGSADADATKAHEYGRDALWIGVRAFRLIHADGDLVGLKSGARAERILLRGHGVG